MKFIKKLFKQKKEIGGCGTVETTVYLDDKDFKSYEFEIKTVGIGDSGSSSSGLIKFSKAIEVKTGGSGGSGKGTYSEGIIIHTKICPHCGRGDNPFPFSGSSSGGASINN
jgi:hypothetical protein